VNCIGILLFYLLSGLKWFGIIIQFWDKILLLRYERRLIVIFAAMRAYLKSDDCLFLLSTKMTTIGREGCDLVLSVWFCHCIFWIVHKWCHAILGKNYRPYSFSHVSSRFSGPIQIWRHKLLTPSPLAVCSVVKFFYMIWHIWWGTAVFAGGHFWLNSIRVLVRVGIWLILFLHSCTASLHGW